MYRFERARLRDVVNAATTSGDLEAVAAGHALHAALTAAHPHTWEPVLPSDKGASGFVCGVCGAFAPTIPPEAP